MQKFLLILSACLLSVGIACLSQAQVPMTGAGKGVPSAVVYVGLGDLQTFANFYSFRCYSAAYASNVARIRSPADALTTTITCSGNGVLSSTGTALATTCAVSCTVDILYDQTGGGQNLTQATEANRPVLTLNAVGSKNCATFDASVPKDLIGTGTGSISQPYSITAFAKRTGNTSAFGAIIIGDDAITGSLGLYYNNSADGVILFGGSLTTAAVTATDNSFHAINGVISGIASELMVDGVNTASLATGVGGFGTGVEIGNSANSLPTTGLICEAGVVASNLNASARTAIDSNQRAYWQ